MTRNTYRRWCAAAMVALAGGTVGCESPRPEQGATEPDGAAAPNSSAVVTSEQQGSTAKSKEAKLPDVSPVLDISLTRQDGQLVTLREMSVTPIVLTFVHTKDDRPARSVAVARHAATLQEAFDAEIDRPIRVVLLTTDPRFDTIDRLREFADLHRLTHPATAVVRPHPDVSKRFYDAFEVPVMYDRRDDSITHPVRWVVLNREGEAKVVIRGEMFDRDEAVRTLRGLAGDGGGIRD